MNDQPAATKTIVVGVDGSKGSVTALRWATRQARLTGDTVVALAAWQEPATYGFAYGSAPALFEGADLTAAAGEGLRGTVAEVAGAEPTVRIDQVVREGQPAQVLLDASRGADLLVVGSRGHGTLTGMLLGSVSQHCVAHAACPVVVVPGE